MKGRLSVALSLALVSGAAMAALPAFETVDANGDGQISMEEAKPHTDVMGTFRAADVDKDGQLNKTEYEAIKQ